MGYLIKDEYYSPEYIKYLNERKKEIDISNLGLRNLKKVYAEGSMWCASLDGYDAHVFTRKDQKDNVLGYVSFVDYNGDRASKLCICQTFKRAIKYCDNIIGKLMSDSK